jgi:Arc/MetJ-type ribon-helix-helix transcriptional regulator
MTTKIAVSLPDELVVQARAAVQAGAATSVSAYVAQAMRTFGRSESLADVVAEIYGEIGRPTARDRAWVGKALDSVEDSAG